MSAPEWLPGMVNVNGDPQNVITTLHGVFDADFRLYGRHFLTMRVWWDRRVIDPPSSALSRIGPPMLAKKGPPAE
jgi:hypothetical protein